MRKQFKIGSLLRAASGIGVEGVLAGRADRTLDMQSVTFTCPVMLVADMNTDPQEYSAIQEITPPWFSLLVLSPEGKLVWCMRHWFEEA